MSRKGILSLNHQLIMEHIKNPDNSPLPVEQQRLMKRIVSMSQLLDNYPTVSMCIKVHRSKYSDISHTTAYNDLALARSVYKNVHNVDYDFWSAWIVNDIIRNIEDCRLPHNNNVAHKKVIAIEHQNLMRAIGEKPTDLEDPTRNEKHNFYLVVGQNLNINVNELHKLPEKTVAEINRALTEMREIDEQGAAEIMES